MRSPIIAVFLALSAAAAAAQCVAKSPVAMSAATPVVIAAPRGGELIASAVAATHDDIVVMRPAAARPNPSPAMYADEKSDHRTGGAMLFAAVALMSGIALRRYSAPRQ
jgi:protein-disulfide isomerase